MDLSVKHPGVPISAQGLPHYSPAVDLKRGKMSLNFSSQGGAAGAGGSSPTYSSGTTEAFPYGLSGVAMPNYGYTGDLYQFTSNGYPRKSRTCCYCGKVFTRSTTRRYHEKRCPLLRAAVCGIVPDNGKRHNGLGMPMVSSSLARSLEKSPSLSSTSINSLANSKPGSTQSHYSLSTSQLSSPPPPPVLLKREENGLGYHHSPFRGRNGEDREREGPQEFLSPGSRGGSAQDLSSLSRLSPESDGSSPQRVKSEVSDYPVSPYHYREALHLSKSPSKFSPRDEATNKDLTKRDASGGEPMVEAYRENRHDPQTPVGQERQVASPAEGDVLSHPMKASSPRISQQDNELSDISDNDKEEMQTDDDHKPTQPGDTKCGVCGKIFESGWQLHVHEQIHKKFKPYACRFCGLRFSKASLRIEHEKSHMDSTCHLCAICGVELEKAQLQLHVLERHKDSPWICRHCGKAAMSHKDFVEHLQSHNLRQDELFSLQVFLQSTVEHLPKSPVEERAPSEIDEEEELTKDSENVGENENLSMSDSETMNSPGRDSPSENTPTPDQEPASSEKETCTICNQEYPKNHMAYHMKYHEGQKPYECPICGKRFGYKNNMKSHIKLHAGIKPYQCNVCGAKFTRGSTLRRHARRHGISAESVWDLFVRNGNSTQAAGQPSEALLSARKSLGAGEAGVRPPTSTPLHNTPLVKDYVGLPADSPYGSLFNTSTSAAAMSNALLMSYHNHQAAMNAASLSSLFPPMHSTSEGASPAAFLASSHLPQSDALNLSTPKATAHCHDNRQHLSGSVSPTSVDRPRSRSLSGSDVSRPTPIPGPSELPSAHDVAVQVRTCCKSGTENGPGSPSDQASVQSSDSSAAYGGISAGGLENSNETIGNLMNTGRLFKCDHCECFFSEYAMYRIHSKIHARGGPTQPFTCSVCGEDCHDRVYFSLHLSEHLR